MRIKLLLTFSFFLIISILFSFSKLSTGIKRKTLEIIPTNIKKIFKEPAYISETPDYITNDSAHYSKSKKLFIDKKAIIKHQYLAASSTDKNKILDSTATIVYNNLVDSLVPYWYGTPWDYNGVSQKPGNGKIACGYFVFTLLRDAGFKLPRIKMSQAASEQAIKSIVSKDHIKRFSNVSATDFDKAMKKWGNGLYIVGLDNHVGLLEVNEKDAWFIHSTVIHPSCVIKEKVSISPAIEYTNYRVVGKLSNYRTLTKNWLFNEYISLNK